MAEQFYTVLTSIGKAKIANASALGNKVNLTHFALGDGGGKYYNPTESQTELKSEVWRGQIGQIAVDEKNPNWIVIETIIPANQGGFMIREAGIFDDENNLLAVGKYPETYKPQVQDGSAKDLYIRMILEVANTSVVNLKVDPSIILATKKDIEVLEQKMNKKIENIDVPVTEIVDNLTTDDATKALSAKQGKVLRDAKMDKNGGTFTGDVNMNTKKLTAAVLDCYAESKSDLNRVSGDLRLDLDYHNNFYAVPNGNMTISMVATKFDDLLSGTLFLDTNGGYAVTFDDRIYFADGIIPDLTSSGIHIITFIWFQANLIFAFYGGRFL